MATTNAKLAPDVYVDEDKQADFEAKFERMTLNRSILAGLLYAIERDNRSDDSAVMARSHDPAPIYIELATHLSENPKHVRRLIECLTDIPGWEAA